MSSAGGLSVGERCMPTVVGWKSTVRSTATSERLAVVMPLGGYLRKERDRPQPTRRFVESGLFYWERYGRVFNNDFPSDRLS